MCQEDLTRHYTIEPDKVIINLSQFRVDIGRYVDGNNWEIYLIIDFTECWNTNSPTIIIPHVDAGNPTKFQVTLTSGIDQTLADAVTERCNDKDPETAERIDQMKDHLLDTIDRYYGFKPFVIRRPDKQTKAETERVVINAPQMKRFTGHNPVEINAWLAAIHKIARKKEAYFHVDNIMETSEGDTIIAYEIIILGSNHARVVDIHIRKYYSKYCDKLGTPDQGGVLEWL